MSTRNLKKLQKLNETNSRCEQLNESEDEDPMVDYQQNHQNSVKNRFELLDEYSPPDTDDSNSDKENETSSKKDIDKKTNDLSLNNKNDAAKKKNKKKNKKTKKNVNQVKNDDIPKEEDIDATIKEFCELDDTPTTSIQSEVCEGTIKLLTMEMYHLNPYNEMIRRFGAKVVQEGQPRGKIQMRRLKQSMVPNISHKVSPKNETGITMTLVDNRDGILYFNFEHCKEYQLNQNLFLACVEKSGDILSMLALEPVALDILIQSAEILVMAEQPKMASEHIEMAISLSERSYHPQFNVIKGNCRLDYRRAENRSYFIALFKHQHFVGQQGCYRTAMEICKLILSLDPEGDPLAIILVLDYYALLSKQLEYLVTFYRELNSSRNLFLLPNFSFSFPLALFKLGTENSLEDYLDESSQLLQEAIIRFPSMVLPMLEKCGGRIDPRFSEHSYLKASQKKSPICLTYLIDLYIARCHYLWKDSAVQLWLEECIHRALDMVDSNEGLSKDSIKNRFVGVSPNILRHLILSNVKDSIPEELHQGPIYAFDPLPPTDAITTYQVNPRQVIHQGVNLFQQFLRPFMPQNNNNNNQNQENEAAAAAAPPAAPAAVRAAPEAANAEEEPAERRGLIDPHRFQQSFEAMLDSILNILNRPDPD